MEPRDQHEHDAPEVSDSHGEGEHATESSGPEAPQVIGTDAPLISEGAAYQSDWTSEPDRNMVVQTGRIREPNEPFSPNFVMVPVESDRPTQGRSGAGEEKVNAGEKEIGRRGQAGPQGHETKAQPRPDERGRPAQGPSLAGVLLFSGLMALVCGAAGAWGYSHFFGQEKPGDQKSAANDSGSGKDSDPRKNSTSNDKDSNSGKVLEAEAASMAAVTELRRSKEAEKAASRSEEEKQAILDFLKNTLLSAGRPRGESLSEAFWAAGQGKDVTLRKALDMTETQVAETFVDRPLAEAAVREMLGLAYLNVGEPARAVQQYERALALREAMQGDNNPDAAACRNQLAVAYRLSGRTAEAGRLFDRNPNSPAHAAALAVRGATLLLEKKPAEAELKLRECLTIRRKLQPDDWSTFDTESMLGESLLDQKKYAESEPLLLSGYEGLKQREAAIPPQDKHRLTRVIERLVRLYEAWGKKDQAMKWRQMLPETPPPRG